MMRCVTEYVSMASNANNHFTFNVSYALRQTSSGNTQNWNNNSSCTKENYETKSYRNLATEFQLLEIGTDLSYELHTGKGVALICNDSLIYVFFSLSIIDRDCGFNLWPVSTQCLLSPEWFVSPFVIAAECSESLCFKLRFVSPM